MAQYFVSFIDFYHECKCSHRGFEHLEKSNYGYVAGPCNVKTCSCDIYVKFILYISEITRSFRAIDYLYYELGANVIPVKTKKKPCIHLLNEWQEIPIPESTFELWKIHGYFNKGQDKLSYGIIIGHSHRGKNKGKYLEDIKIDFDVNKGTTFQPIIEDPFCNDYMLRLENNEDRQRTAKLDNSHFRNSNCPI